MTSKVKSEAFFGSSAPFPLQFKTLWLLYLVYGVVSSSKLLACFGFRPGSCVWRWLPPQSAAICRRGAAVLHSTERQKRSFVQLQVDENSARAAALHSDLELQNSIELKLGSHIGCLRCSILAIWSIDFFRSSATSPLQFKTL